MAIVEVESVLYTAYNKPTECLAKSFFMQPHLEKLFEYIHCFEVK